MQILSGLKSGRIKYYIINCTLQDIMSDSAVIKELLPEIECVSASFSAHYILDIVDIFVARHVPFIGSCYTYDGIKINESIINTGNISMTRIDIDRAEVKRGKDDSYIEPAIELSDIPGSIIKMNALDTVPLSSYHGMDNAQKMYRYLRILMIK